MLDSSGEAVLDRADRWVEGNGTVHEIDPATMPPLAAAPAVPVALSGITDAATRTALQEVGCLVYEEPTHAVEVLAAKARWAQGKAATATESSAAPIEVQPGALNEADALAFLASRGVPAATGRRTEARSGARSRPVLRSTGGAFASSP